MTALSLSLSRKQKIPSLKISLSTAVVHILGHFVELQKYPCMFVVTIVMPSARVAWQLRRKFVCDETEQKDNGSSLFF